MSTTSQKAFFASLAAFARSTADLLDEMGNSAPAAAATAPAVVAAPKPVKPPKVAAEPKPVETTATPAAKTAEPKPPTNGADGGDILTQARAAAKSYAEVYGREGLLTIIRKYSTGTLADVALEKLPELLKDLS